MKIYQFIAAVSILLFTLIQVSAQDAMPVTGSWAGTWKNNLGQTGTDTLILNEEAGGKVHGTWSGYVEVSGKRVNKNTIELQGSTATLSYQITAVVKEGKMTMKYLVARLDSAGAYDGSSTLQFMSKRFGAGYSKGIGYSIPATTQASEPISKAELADSIKPLWNFKTPEDVQLQNRQVEAMDRALSTFGREATKALVRAAIDRDKESVSPALREFLKGFTDGMIDNLGRPSR